LVIVFIYPLLYSAYGLINLLKSTLHYSVVDRPYELEFLK